MAIVVACACGGRFQTTEENAGRRARCPSCRRSLVVPRGTLAAELEAPREFDPTIFAATSGKAISSLVLGVLSMVLFIFTGIPAIISGWMAWREIERSEGWLKGRALAGLGIGLGVLGCTFVPYRILGPWVTAARVEYARRDCADNLHAIGRAIHAYESERGRFPAAAITDREGTPLSSWRVAILPYLGPEERKLYSEFHLNEPWDSPHNAMLASRMPRVFACTSHPRTALTTFQVVVGPRTAFTGSRRGLFLGEFLDGTSTTILVVEGAAAVPWTAPQEIDANALDLATSPFASSHGPGMNALLADGRVLLIHDSVAASPAMKAHLSPAGNEVVSMPW